MNELTPFVPQRPLMWTEFVFDLQDLLADIEAPLYIVGGAVRDAFLHHPIHDLDLITSGDSITIARQIANQLKGDFYIMDQERGVARIILNHQQEGRLMIDLAQFRAESLLYDLIDRDFTINAVAVDMKGNINQVIDPLDGIKDLLNKLLRRCSPNALKDDPVRTLRAVRMSTQFNLRIEPQTMQDIRSATAALNEVSPERLRDELFKILSLARPVTALRIAYTLGILGALLPEIVLLESLPQAYTPIQDSWQHTLTVVEKLHNLLITISPLRTDINTATFESGMLVVALDHYRQLLQDHIYEAYPNERSQWSLLLLAALLHDTGYPQSRMPDMQNVSPQQISAELAETRCVELRLSTNEKKRVSEVIQHHRRFMSLSSQPTDLEMHRYWYTLGKSGVDVILLGLADYLGSVEGGLNQNEWLQLLEKAQQFLHTFYHRYDEIVSPTLLVDGNQLMTELGLQPGPQIGHLLNLIREGQVMKDIHTVDDALNAARHTLNGKHN